MCPRMDPRLSASFEREPRATVSDLTNEKLVTRVAQL